MGKSRMFGALISVEAETQLLDATETLEFRRVNQLSHETALGRIGIQLDDVVDGISVYALSQVSLPWQIHLGV